MLTLVPTPIGNLSDISKRSLDALFSAHTILCEDTRITKKLLSLLKERYTLADYAAQIISLHSHNENSFVASLKTEFFDNAIVYVSDAGMPGISDPGQLLVDYCLEHSLPYEVLPGASASILAFVASGFIKTEFLFGGFLPHKGKERETKLNEMLYSGYTTVLYESPHRLLKCLEELATLVPDRRIFIAKELTKKYENKQRASAKELYEKMKIETIKGEWIIVIEAAGKQNLLSITQDEVLKLSLPPKEKSKLLATFGEKSSKEWYTYLQENKV